MKVVLLPHSTDIQHMIAASNVLVLPKERKGSMPYERIAASYKVPTILRGAEDDSYVIDENCYLFSNDLDQLANTVYDTFVNKEKRLALGQKAWETLTISKEVVSEEIEQAYRTVIRRYYDKIRQ